MKLLTNLYIAILLLLCSINLNGQIASEKTKVLILGTPHLNQIPNFQPKMLDNLVIKLDSLKFDAVCIENMPGELLYDIESREDSAYTYIVEHIAGLRFALADSMQVNLGIGFVESEKNAKDLLKKETLADADRVQLIEYLIASTDIYSATLQYKLIKEKSTFDGSNISQYTMAVIEKYGDDLNEISSLALRLASNQNLQKLEYIDNLQDESFLYKHFPNFTEDFTDNQELFKDIGNSPVFLKFNELITSGITDEDLLDVYLFMNSEEYMIQDYEAQHVIWLNSNFESGTDRARYSLWEMRNIQITANILKTCAFYPGKNVIVIIGASHKSFIEKYLKQVPDIELLELK
ncbi:MAG: hypothetical protein HN729_09895 [Candidatus Marinimicrobia bacterium]|jgi:hypothetical protein|nr:hypothetical protein [Candidatus Neomarinimicrobiota bacterium]MBT3635011.1 hypothetical protein [Candidatus Neomarinimicrobiota bacterium]MBT3683842.1 hypothetical protein [Candidatus Neomarinimicrobiota bacterium]MBT3760663.1 hypothetical protein [Candidatus Neomarinimicrobiota bacterium]MBT3896852.1 hypothetical protein [Candidatus Neomarinimicrobiota bacterium]